MKSIATLIFLFFSLAVFSQMGNGYRFGNVDAGGQVALSADFNHQDVTVLGRVGFYDKFNLWGIGGEFGMRPFRKNVELKEGENLFIQYREIRTVTGIYVEKRILPFEFRNNQQFGFVFGTSVGGQFANFAGIRSGEWEFWVAPYAGFSFNFKENFFTDFGYRYDNVKGDATPHKLFITITGIF